MYVCMYLYPLIYFFNLCITTVHVHMYTCVPHVHMCTTCTCIPPVHVPRYVTYDMHTHVLCMSMCNILRLPKVHLKLETIKNHIFFSNSRRKKNIKQMKKDCYRALMFPHQKNQIHRQNFHL